MGLIDCITPTLIDNLSFADPFAEALQPEHDGGIDLTGAQDGPFDLPVDVGFLVAHAAVIKVFGYPPRLLNREFTVQVLLQKLKRLPRNRRLRHPRRRPRSNNRRRWHPIRLGPPVRRWLSASNMMNAKS